MADSGSCVGFLTKPQAGAWSSSVTSYSDSPFSSSAVLRARSALRSGPISKFDIVTRNAGVRRGAGVDARWQGRAGPSRMGPALSVSALPPLWPSTRFGHSDLQPCMSQHCAFVFPHSRQRGLHVTSGTRCRRQLHTLRECPMRYIQDRASGAHQAAIGGL